LYAGQSNASDSIHLRLGPRSTAAGHFVWMLLYEEAPRESHFHLFTGAAK